MNAEVKGDTEMQHQSPVVLMNRGLLAAVVAVAVVVLAVTETRADPEPIAAEPLTERHAFDGEVSIAITQQLEGLSREDISHEDASYLTVMQFTIQPGAVFPWHTHPGTVLVNVTQGDFVFMFAEDCVGREYGPGDALVDPGDTVHTAYNPSTEQETVITAVFVGVPEEGELTIPVDEARSAALDDECGIER